ncbi:hypothetical protein [Synechococcus sp. PCC 7336]|uniref:hypothetical protein n=1 Tax=Synechococcus sp. PCC 7336 TaxID=195250 RepID=UPI000349F3D8|nr:hypothetical protein [Synechococcus sp. PCC 7336]
MERSSLGLNVNGKPLAESLDWGTLAKVLKMSSSRVGFERVLVLVGQWHRMAGGDRER